MSQHKDARMKEKATLPSNYVSTTQAIVCMKSKVSNQEKRVKQKQMD